MTRFLDWFQQTAGAPFDAAFVLILLIVTFAGFLRGFIGFGSALICIPVVTLVFGPRLAVPVVTLISLPGMFQLLPDAIRHSERPIVLPIALGIFLTAPLGTWVLVSIDPAIMKIVISALVVVMVAFLAMGWQLKQHVHRGLLLLAGGVGGMVQGVSGMGGPPVVAVALSRTGSPERQRGNVLGVMTAIALSALPAQYYYGLFTTQVFVISAILLPPHIVSTWLGSRYFSSAGKAYFRRVALIVLAIIGVTTLWLSVEDAIAGAL